MYTVRVWKISRPNVRGPKIKTSPRPHGEGGLHPHIFSKKMPHVYLKKMIYPDLKLYKILSTTRCLVVLTFSIRLFENQHVVIKYGAFYSPNIIDHNNVLEKYYPIIKLVQID